MGAEFSRSVEETIKKHEQEQQQEQQRTQSQPQQQQQQQQQRPQSQPQHQQRPQPQQQQQQQKPLPHEGNSRDAWLLPPHSEAKPSTNTPKAVEDVTVVKPRGTQSLTPAKSSKELNLPHNYEDILKRADSPVDKSSREKLLDQLYAGVFLDHKTKASSMQLSSMISFLLLTLSP